MVALSEAARQGGSGVVACCFVCCVFGLWCGGLAVRADDGKPRTRCKRFGLRCGGLAVRAYCECCTQCERFGLQWGAYREPCTWSKRMRAIRKARALGLAVEPYVKS